MRKYTYFLCFSLLLQGFRCKSKRLNFVYPQSTDNIKQHFDFETAIQNMRKKADQRRSIPWHIQEDTLYRDATDASGQMYTSEDYVVQILSIFRAAKVLCQVQNKNANIFNTMAHNFMKQYNNEITYAFNKEDKWYHEVININKLVLDQLQTIFPEQKRSELNTNLRLAENYAGLEDKHFNITTTFKVQDQYFQLEDKKCSTLTQVQILHLKNRVSELWYKQLSHIEQKLLDHYIDKILDGQHCIPTQLRQLPGCRNAYQKRIIAQNAQNKVLGQYAHLGTIHSFNKTLSKQFTKENWDQLCQNNNSQRLNMMIFNHNSIFGPIYPGEQDIVNQTRDTVAKQHFMCFPINIMGSYSNPEFKLKTNALLNQINDAFHNQYPHICNIIMKNKLSSQALTELDATIQNIEDEDTKLFFQRTKTLKIATDLSDKRNKLIHNIKKQENYYAQLASDYIFCQTTLDQLNKDSNINLAISCKSGKDRTGYISLLSDGKLIEHHLHGKVELHKIYNAIASSAHIQLLASLNGGMPGRVGIKKHVIKHKNITAFSDEKLFYRAASLTKIAD